MEPRIRRCTIEHSGDFARLAAGDLAGAKAILAVLPEAGGRAR